METLITLQITIFLLVATGFVLKKIHISGAPGTEKHQRYGDLCDPALQYSAGVSGQPCRRGIDVLYRSAFDLCLYSGFLRDIRRILFRREPEGRNKCLRYGTICSNAGFLGNPIAEGVYGAEGLMLASIYLIPQRIMMWSSGLAVFSGVSDKKQTLKKVMTHPCILACILGIIFMFAGVELPPGLDGMVTALGNCNTAMSMMVIGMILADINPKDFWDLTVVKYTVHRLIVIPGIVYIACRFLPLDRTLWDLCSSGGNAGRRHDEYTGGKI